MTTRPQQVYDTVAKVLAEHHVWQCGPFSFRRLGRDGVKLTCDRGDESEAVLLDKEQVKQLRRWLEAR